MTQRQENRRRAPGSVRSGWQLQRLSDAELNALFRASPAAAVPHGVARGWFLPAATGTWFSHLAALVSALLWQGKLVDADAGELRNLVSVARVRAIRGALRIGPSMVDGLPALVVDYSRTSFVARSVRDEIRLVAPNLYLGVVWLGRRRAGWFTLHCPSQELTG